MILQNKGGEALFWPLHEDVVDYQIRLRFGTTDNRTV